MVREILCWPASNTRASECPDHGLLVTWQKQVSDLRVDGLTIDRTGHHGIEGNVSGKGTFSHTEVARTAAAPLDMTGGFTIQRGSGNSGW